MIRVNALTVPFRLIIALGLLYLADLAESHSHAEAPAPQRPRIPINPWHAYVQARQYVKQIHPPEIFEMVAAIAGGSEMGPGEGWFHGGELRFGWKWLAERYDLDKDGKITREEFRGPSDLFDRLDRNHDGTLTSTDFDWSDRSLFAMQGMPASFWFRMVDANSNGRISKEEWLEYFARASKGKGYLTPDDLREAFPTSPPPRPKSPEPQKNTGPSPVLLISGLLSGELGSMFEGPRVGTLAPDFALRTHDGKRNIHMADYRGKKPVVLIFGSFT